MVTPNRKLIEWSQRLAEKQRIDLPPHYRSDRVKRFKQMNEELEALPESQWPARSDIKRRKRDRDFEARVDDMIAHRNNIASGLDIDGSLIASRAVIESIASNEAEATRLLMNWQRGLLGL